MASGGDRDQAVERLLRTSLADELAASSPDCLDAEQLAAWSDGTLTPFEARAAEVHVASCARCQSMAAAFARTMPATAAPAAAPRVWGLHWLMPFAAAAAAVGLWFLVPHGAPVAPSTSQTVPMVAERQPELPQIPPPSRAEDTEIALAAPTTAPVAQASGEPVGSLGKRREEAAEAKTAAVMPVGESRGAPPPAASALPPAVPAPARRDTTDVQNLPINRGSFGPARAAAPAASRSGSAESAPQAPGVPAGNVMIDGISAVDERPLVQAQSGERSSTLSMSPVTIPEVVVAAEFSAARARVVASPAIGGGRAGAPAAAPLMAPSAPPIRWRVLTDGRVQRSTTNGTSWDAVAIDATVRVTAGVSPAPLVCWLVGPRGVVLRSTDALHFERLTFPDAVDLVTVTAADDHRATVTTADGRAFATTDGGVAWRLEPR